MNDTVLKELLTTADRGIRKREDRLIASVERQALSSIAERRMDTLCRQMTGDRYHAVYGKVRVLLIAAIVAGLLMATAAGAVWYRAVVRYDEKRGENVYHVEGGGSTGCPRTCVPRSSRTASPKPSARRETQTGISSSCALATAACWPSRRARPERISSLTRRGATTTGSNWTASRISGAGLSQRQNRPDTRICSSGRMTGSSSRRVFGRRTATTRIRSSRR